MTRVVVVSSCDPLADVAAAGLFDPDHGLAPDHHLELSGVVRTRMPPETRGRLIRRARDAGALFYARYMFAEMNLPRLWPASARPERLLDRARLAGAPVLETDAVNGEEAIGFVQSRSPDLVLSIRPGTIFRQRLIEAIPPILNFHGSMLPEFRGIGGVLQALAAGRETLGCTVHLVADERVDGGPILAQTSHATTPGRSVYYHTIGLYRAAPLAFVEATRALAAGSEPSPNEGGSYFSWPDRSVLKRLHRSGRRLLEPRDARVRNLV